MPNAPTASGRLEAARLRSWPWVAHRIAAVITVLSLVLHVLGAGLARLSPDDYNSVAALYQSTLTQTLQVVVVAGALYYVLSGLALVVARVEPGTRADRVAGWLTVLVWVVLMVPAGYLVLDNPVRQLFGSA